MDAEARRRRLRLRLRPRPSIQEDNSAAQPLVLLMMAGFGSLLGYYAYTYLLRAIIDERRTRIMDYDRILLRWNEYQRADFDNENFEVAFNNQPFTRMRKKITLTDSLDLSEHDSVHGLDIDVYKPLVYSANLYTELTSPDWRTDAFLELKFRGSTFPERVIDKIPFTVTKMLNMAEFENSGRFIDSTMIKDGKGNERSLQRLAVYERQPRGVEFGDLPTDEGQPMEDQAAEGKSEQSLNRKAVERTNETMELRTREGEHSGDITEELPKNSHSWQRNLRSHQRHNVFTEHGCSRWTFDASHRSVCIQKWYLHTVCLFYDPGEHTLDFSAPITSMDPKDLEATAVVCGQPVYGDDQAHMARFFNQPARSIMLQPDKYVAIGNSLIQESDGRAHNLVHWHDRPLNKRQAPHGNPMHLSPFHINSPLHDRHSLQESPENSQPTVDVPRPIGSYSDPKPHIVSGDPAFSDGDPFLFDDFQRKPRNKTQDEELMNQVLLDNLMDQPRRRLSQETTVESDGASGIKEEWHTEGTDSAQFRADKERFLKSNPNNILDELNKQLNSLKKQTEREKPTLAPRPDPRPYLGMGDEDPSKEAKDTRSEPLPPTNIPVTNGVFGPVRPPVYRSPGIQLNRHSPHVEVTIRSTEDPYIYAKSISDGTMDFGMEAKTGFFVGIILLVTALCVCAAPIFKSISWMITFCGSQGSSYSRPEESEEELEDLGFVALQETVNDNPPPAIPAPSRNNRENPTGGRGTGASEASGSNNASGEGGSRGNSGDRRGGSSSRHSDRNSDGQSVPRNAGSGAEPFLDSSGRRQGRRGGRRSRGQYTAALARINGTE